MALCQHPRHHALAPQMSQRCPVLLWYPVAHLKDPHNLLHAFLHLNLRHYKKIFQNTNKNMTECLTLAMLVFYSGKWQIIIIIFFFWFYENNLKFHSNCLQRRQSEWNVKLSFQEKVRKVISQTKYIIEEILHSLIYNLFHKITDT